MLKLPSTSRHTALDRTLLRGGEVGHGCVLQGFNEAGLVNALDGTEDCLLGHEVRGLWAQLDIPRYRRALRHEIEGEWKAGCLTDMSQYTSVVVAYEGHAHDEDGVGGGAVGAGVGLGGGVGGVRERDGRVRSRGRGGGGAGYCCARGGPGAGWRRRGRRGRTCRLAGACARSRSRGGGRAAGRGSRGLHRARRCTRWWSTAATRRRSVCCSSSCSASEVSGSAGTRASRRSASMRPRVPRGGTPRQTPVARREGARRTS